MHEAYQISSILKLNYQIESLTAYDDNLLVGTRQGYLFMYNVSAQDDKFDVQLMRYNKSFSKKPIQQLEVIPDHHLLISLSDNIIQVHDVNAINFPMVNQVLSSKGATYFALSVKKPTSLTGASTTVVRMAVIVKRKIQLYYLKNNEFNKLAGDINLTDIPRSCIWCNESICVGFKNEYTLFGLDGKPTELFPTSSSRSSEPCMTQASDTCFALCRDTQTVFVNENGETEKTTALRWTDVPVALVWDEPYGLAALQDKIEVLTPDAPGLTQEILEAQKIRFLIRCAQGLVFGASVSQVWVLKAVDIAKQRKYLLENKQFQLALKLTSMSNESEEDKDEKVHQIQTLLAYDLFGNKKFHESMREFAKLNTDPYDVIRLFPELLPQQSNEQAQPENVPALVGKDLENGLLALIKYLTEMRLKLSTDGPTGESKGKSTQQLLQIIDTTLLKCYLQTNDVLVAPLLRLNNCHLAEAEKVLKKMGRHNELVILYQTKGQHRRALDLLRTENAVERTITYLQHLGVDHVGLILEFADWVLKESPEEGLKIFTEDLTEVEALPRPRVLDFLLCSHPTLVIPYLEHVVHVWRDDNSLFHNALVHQYRERALSGESDADRCKKLLLEFLEKNKHYRPETLLPNFSSDSLLEERAFILGRLGRHDQALTIFICLLGNMEKAINYCEKVYDQDVPSSKSVYVSLLKLILDPDSSPPIEGSKSPTIAQPNLELALKLLQEHASQIDPIEALSVLPDGIPLVRLRSFLLIALQKTLNQRRMAQLLSKLLYDEHLQSEEFRLKLEAQNVLITELNVCPSCKKRFGNQSALVRYPNGEVVHYSCQEKKMI